MRGPLENMLAFAAHPDLNIITKDVEEAKRMKGTMAGR